MKSALIAKSDDKNKAKLYEKIILKGLGSKMADTREIGCECVSSMGTVANLSTPEIDVQVVTALQKITVAKGESVQGRTKALLAMGRLSQRLPAHTVFEHVLPVLPKIPDVAHSAALAMCVNGILKVTLDKKKPSREMLAKLIIPALSPL